MRLIIASFLFPFWFVRNVKHILFWIYLWQLKQYHRRRFFDHFLTEKGKKLIFHPLQIFKIVLLIFCFIIALFFYNDYVFFLPLFLFLLYFIESLFYFKSLFAGKAKNPHFTKKTVFLFGANILVLILFFTLLFFLTNIFWFAFFLLLFDVLLPVVVSSLVIVFQPLADYYRISLQKKAKEKIKKFESRIKIIAIVGSYGKTSTKEYLAAILSSRFKVLSTQEHQNTEVAIPQMILDNLTPEYEILIAELGAYDKGTIKRICDFLRPDIGVITGINEQHLALFGSMENLISAEGGLELIRSLPENGILVLNGNNPIIQNLKIKNQNYNSKLKNVIVSTKEKADYWAEDIKVQKEQLSFKVFSKNNQNIGFNIKAFGAHNIENVLMAAAVANNLGMSLKEIAKAAEEIKPEQLSSSYKISKNSNGLNIIDSTYSANPDGVIADLDYLKIYSGKKIIIMPCLIELGSVSKEIHQKIGRKIAEVCDLAIMVSKECFNAVKEGALKNGMKEDKIELLQDADLIVKKINSLCDENDTVLLEGRLSLEIIDKIKK